MLIHMEEKNFEARVLFPLVQAFEAYDGTAKERRTNTQFRPEWGKHNHALKQHRFDRYRFGAVKKSDFGCWHCEGSMPD